MVLLALGLAGLPAVTLLCTGTSGEPPLKLRIEDASQPRQLVFRAAPDQSVSGMTLRVRGHLDGSAVITAIEDRWRTETLTGRIDWAIYHDWFPRDCTIDYRPVPGTSGSLDVELTFH